MHIIIILILSTRMVLIKRHMRELLFWTTNNEGLKSSLVSHCLLKLFSNNICVRGWLSCIKAIFATRRRISKAGLHTSDFHRVSRRHIGPRRVKRYHNNSIIFPPKRIYYNNINIIILSFIYIICTILCTTPFVLLTNARWTKSLFDIIVLLASNMKRLITGATFISLWSLRFTRQYDLTVALIVNCIDTARLLSRENRSSLQVKVYIVARWYIKYSSVFGVGTPVFINYAIRFTECLRTARKQVSLHAMRVARMMPRQWRRRYARWIPIEIGLPRFACQDGINARAWRWYVSSNMR